MKQKLAGTSIALAGSRRASEMRHLIEKMGGKAFFRPTQVTHYEQPEVLAKQMFELLKRPVDWFIFTTGVGLRKLFYTAQQFNLHASFLQHIRNSRIAVRGYKVLPILKQARITIDLRSHDGTTQSIIQQLAPVDLKHQKIFIQSYGESHGELTRFFWDKQADFTEVIPYHYAPPPEAELDRLIQELFQKKYDALLFTSSPQVKYLFAYAQQQGVRQRLLETLSTHTIVGSVGKQTSKQLKQEGVERMIMPQRERMGSLIVTLGDYYKSMKQQA